MPRHHIIDDVKVPFTEAEELAQDELEAVWEAGANDREMNALRRKRNRLLANTDWWVLRGSPTDAQTAYRQALRDLPANTADPTNPTWPVEPA